MNEKLRHLIGRIESLGFRTGSEAVVSLDEFFTGNPEHFCNLCVNNVDLPTTQQVQQALAEIKAKANVQDVLIRIVEIDDPLMSDGCWVGSDTVYTLAGASLESVAEWFAPLRPSEVTEDGDLAGFAGAPELESGERVFVAWWD